LRGALDGCPTRHGTPRSSSGLPCLGSTDPGTSSLTID
jgi:hypothetical protein